MNILKQYINDLEMISRDLEDLILRGKLIILSKEIQNLFMNNYSNLPIKRRLEKIKSIILFLIEPYEKEWIDEIYKELYESGDFIYKEEMVEKSSFIVNINLKHIYDKISKITDFNLIEIYKNLFKNLNIISKNKILSMIRSL